MGVSLGYCHKCKKELLTTDNAKTKTYYKHVRMQCNDNVEEPRIDLKCIYCGHDYNTDSNSSYPIKLQRFQNHYCYLADR